MLCERCGADIHKYEVCRYCTKKICNNCMKSSRRVSKVLRIVICADCWSIMKKRKAFKSMSKEQA